MGRTEEGSGDRAHMGGLTCCNTSVREVCEKVFSVKTKRNMTVLLEKNMRRRKEED